MSPGAALAETQAALSPRANPHLFGHAAAEAVLLSAYRSGRLPHTWLICGPRGVGKATLAYRFARFVLATGADLGGPREPGLFGGDAPPTSLALAPDHPVFCRVASGGHGDLLSIERREDDRGRLKSEIPVEESRTAADFLHLTPAEGGWRIIVIDAVEEMNRHAANALLKIIEEPPDKALILMISHAPGRLLPTIRSRCRLLPLKALPASLIGEVLRAQCPELAPDDVRILADLAEGSAGRAIELASHGGLALYRELSGMLQRLPALDIAALHRFADRMSGSEGEVAFRTTADLLQWWLSRRVRAAARGEAAAEKPPGAGEEGRLVGLGNLDRWLEVWEKTRHLLYRSDSLNLERKQIVLNAVLALEAAART